jgi:hypothetical protein
MFFDTAARRLVQVAGLRIRRSYHSFADRQVACFLSGWRVNSVIKICKPKCHLPCELLPEKYQASETTGWPDPSLPLHWILAC